MFKTKVYPREVNMGRTDREMLNLIVINTSMATEMVVDAAVAFFDGVMSEGHYQKNKLHAKIGALEMQLNLTEVHYWQHSA